MLNMFATYLPMFYFARWPQPRVHWADPTYYYVFIVILTTQARPSTWKHIEKALMSSVPRIPAHKYNALKLTRDRIHSIRSKIADRCSLVIGAVPWWILSRQMQFWLGGVTPESPLPLRAQGPYLTQCVIGPRSRRTV